MLGGLGAARGPLHQHDPGVRRVVRLQRPRHPDRIRVTGRAIRVAGQRIAAAGAGTFPLRSPSGVLLTLREFREGGRTSGRANRDATPGGWPAARTASIWAWLIAPRRSTRGGSAVQSTIVDSTPTAHGPPSTTRSRRGSIRAPSSSSTSVARVGLTRPKRFALGAATPRAGSPVCPSERLEAGQRDRVVRAPQGDGVLAPGEEVPRAPAAPDDDGQRARPERLGQSLRRGVAARAPRSQGLRTVDVHDERMTRGTPLDAVHPAHGIGVLGISSQPVDRLGGQADQATGDPGAGGPDCGHGVDGTVGPKSVDEGDLHRPIVRRERAPADWRDRAHGRNQCPANRP